MNAAALDACEVCGQSQMRFGPCHHCAVCVKTIDMDNCDQDLTESGRVVTYLGSSEAFRCVRCDEFVHNACGDRKQELCKACLGS